MTNKYSHIDDRDSDDIRAVMNSLRNYCSHVVDIKKAIPIVAEKTGLTQERIKYILKVYFKGD